MRILKWPQARASGWREPAASAPPGTSRRRASSTGSRFRSAGGASVISRRRTGHPREVSLSAPEPKFAPVPPTTSDLVAEVEKLGERLQQVRERIARVIFGQTQVIDNSLITLLGGG